MKNAVSILILLLLCGSVSSQKDNISAAKGASVSYQLPDVFKAPGGKAIAKNHKKWEKKVRPTTLALFEEQVYGKIPKGLIMTSFRIMEESDATPYANCTRRQVEMLFEKNGKTLRAEMLMYLPKREEKTPIFIGYNFFGNHTTTTDPEVFISESWSRNNASFGIANNQLSEKNRGVRVNRWPIEEILKSGFGLATIYYGDIDPDDDDFSNGVHPLLYAEGQTAPRNNEWGAISAWAWALCCAMDYMETDPNVDAGKVIVMGHSRLGKVALWAGALDQRFAMVISNESGCGGAALSRRREGETVEAINTSFPHWFCTNFKAYNNNEDSLPVDQHQLIAMIAPRPVYIASAQEDLWADPFGEYLSGYHASPVYKLFGKIGLTSADMPPVNTPIMNQIGYHIRTGVHDITLYDWQQFIRFADYHFK
ncbi:MAG: hypothetical protein FWG22_02110 [Prolixibacteraceae bacterium]|nr:hypothetical protein [Prolixibacteraceae bacterium]